MGSNILNNTNKLLRVDLDEEGARNNQACTDDRHVRFNDGPHSCRNDVN